MSHFTVLVIGEDVEDQLDKFWELDLKHKDAADDPRAEFVVEVPKAELVLKSEEDARDTIRYYRGRNIKYGKLKAKGKLKEAVESMMHGGFGYTEDRYLECINSEMARNREEVRKYQKLLAAGDWKATLKAYSGGGLGPDGDWGYYRNPNAKWDWYEIGGRWRGSFIMKNGKRSTDQALKGDIDFDAMKAKHKKGAEKSWAVCEAKKANKKPVHPYLEHGIHIDDTKESYIARQTSVSTHAVVKDGNWYEQGKMGWFAVVYDEKDDDVWQEEFDKLIMSLPDDTLLTLVDCHI